MFTSQSFHNEKIQTGPGNCVHIRRCSLLRDVHDERFDCIVKSCTSHQATHWEALFQVRLGAQHMQLHTMTIVVVSRIRVKGFGYIS